MFVRLSRARFAAEKYDEVAELVQSAETVLAPAIRSLTGLIDYYAGIDRESSTLIRVSVWDTAEHAEQMASLAEIKRLRGEFEAVGVEWEPTNTYSVAWWVQSS